MSGFQLGKNTKQFLRCLLALCNIFSFCLLFWKWHHARGGSFVSSAYLLPGVSLKKEPHLTGAWFIVTEGVSSLSLCDKPKATFMMSSESRICCFQLFKFQVNFGNWCLVTRKFTLLRVILLQRKKNTCSYNHFSKWDSIHQLKKGKHDRVNFYVSQIKQATFIQLV